MGKGWLGFTARRWTQGRIVFLAMGEAFCTPRRLSNPSTATELEEVTCTLQGAALAGVDLFIHLAATALDCLFLLPCGAPLLDLVGGPCSSGLSITTEVRGYKPPNCALREVEVNFTDASRVFPPSRIRSLTVHLPRRQRNDRLQMLYCFLGFRSGCVLKSPMLEGYMNEDEEV